MLRNSSAGTLVISYKGSSSKKNAFFPGVIIVFVSYNTVITIQSINPRRLIFGLKSVYIIFFVTAQAGDLGHLTHTRFFLL